MKSHALWCLAFLVGAGTVSAQQDSIARAKQCPPCAEWNAPHKPLKLFGNAYFVGTDGLSAVLITSPGGHILIDGGLPESAPRIIENIRALGFLIEDVRLLLNSHTHDDHAGGLAALQVASGAEVAASPASAPALRAGAVGPNDPQQAIALPYPKVSRVRTFVDGETLEVGALSITAHFTGGHTPGGTSFTWRSCEGSTCANMVYADSFTPISANGFLYTKSTTYPTALADFERSHRFLETTACDILVTPHPGASMLWERVNAREKGEMRSLRSSGQCKRYAAAARAALARRLAEERGK